MVAFITSSALDREGTCDHRPLLAGDLLMYIALAQTVVGFFGPYLRLLEGASMGAEVEQESLSRIWVGMMVPGSALWILATYEDGTLECGVSPAGRSHGKRRPRRRAEQGSHGLKQTSEPRSRFPHCYHPAKGAALAVDCSQPSRNPGGARHQESDGRREP